MIEDAVAGAVVQVDAIGFAVRDVAEAAAEEPYDDVIRRDPKGIVAKADPVSRRALAGDGEVRVAHVDR